MGKYTNQKEMNKDEVKVREQIGKKCKTHEK